VGAREVGKYLSTIEEDMNLKLALKEEERKNKGEKQNKPN